VLEHLPTGVLVLDRDGRIATHNPAAERMLGEAVRATGARCCDVLGCGRPETDLEGVCVAELGRTASDEAVELRAVAGEAELWLAAGPLAPHGHVVVHLRRDRRSRARPAAGLRVRVLGATRIEADGADLGGEWLDHRPGQVLKYLVTARGRTVSLDELLDVLWARPGRSGATNVRQAVHALRDRLEPGRARRSPSRFVIGRRGGYELAPEAVWVDADAFTEAAEAGLAALARGDLAWAEPALARAAALYTGEYLVDEQEADWALAERARLRSVAVRVLRSLGRLRVRHADLEGASDALQRLAELEPLDLDAQRALLTLLVHRGRRSEAARRYEIVRRRYRRAFGEEPSFKLAELARRG
jgi:DNA-binding SARP family transcriptional activator